MKYFKYHITAVAVAFSLTTACSKKPISPVSQAGLYGQWKLAYSASPYLARIDSPPPGSILNLDSVSGRYAITWQGKVQDAGTYMLSKDELDRSTVVIYFNYFEYFEYGTVDHKSAYIVQINGGSLRLTFLTTMEFFTTPVIQFQKQ
jgi:hypothetical protein